MRDAVGGGDLRQGVLQGRRARADDAVEHLGESHAGLGADGDHGVERTARDRGLEVADERVLRDLLAREVALQ